MEEILEGIKELKTFVDKKQQWDVVNKIEGNKETISEPEKQDREKFKNAKRQLINAIDLTINRSDFNQITNEPKIAEEHLLALKGFLSITNFDNIVDEKVYMEKFMISILKDIKNKTLEQEIEIKECEDEYKRNVGLKEKFKQDNEEKFQEDKEPYQYEMLVVNKTKDNIFTKIKQFFKNNFGKNKRIRKQNMIKREEELKFNKQSVAPLLEIENDGEQQKNFNDILQTQREFGEYKKELDKQKSEFDEQKSEFDETKKEFRKILKVNGKYAEWKNGNIIITDDIDQKEDENIIE